MTERQALSDRKSAVLAKAINEKSQVPTEPLFLSPPLQMAFQCAMISCLDHHEVMACLLVYLLGPMCRSEMKQLVEREVIFDQLIEEKVLLPTLKDIRKNAMPYQLKGIWPAEPRPIKGRMLMPRPPTREEAKTLLHWVGQILEETRLQRGVPTDVKEDAYSILFWLKCSLKGDFSIKKELPPIRVISTGIAELYDLQSKALKNAKDPEKLQAPEAWPRFERWMRAQESGLALPEVIPFWP